MLAGINEEGQREILGLETAFSETEEAWRRFIGQLKRGGLSGVEMATSDAHEGLVQALQEAFPDLVWQRCQAHFRRNVFDQTPASYKDRIHQMLERFIEEIRRREKVIRIFPNLGSVERLIGALFAETHEGWLPSRRYLTMDEFFEWMASHQTRESEAEAPAEPALAAP